MIQAKGYAAHQPGTVLVPWSFERRAAGPRDIQIDILYCGICHSDLHQLRNDWFPGAFPMVPGHEIVGKVVQVGSEVRKFKTGDRAGVGVMVDSCRTCDNCKAGQEQFCEVHQVPTYNGKDKEGKPTYGGYSDTIVVDADFAHLIPDTLDLAATAPLLCAGITTYAPLRNWKVGKGHKLAVVGLGGLGHLGVKFGVALGAEVTILSTSASKQKDAQALGAHHFVVTTDPARLATVKGSFDFILDTVSAPHDLNQYLSLLKTNGVHICVGAPVEPYALPAFSLMMGNKAVAGSGAGGLAQTQEMLDFCAEKGIVSDIELINIADMEPAFARIEKGDVRYRFVIDMATLEK